MVAGKRVADAPPGVPPKHTDKKQKTTPAGPTAAALLKTPAQKTHKTEKTQKGQNVQKAQHIVPIRPEASRNASAGFTVVPATPGTMVDLGEAATTNAKGAEKPSKEKPKETQANAKAKAPPPTTLPLEPHAAILGELQHKYAVRVLSVISSTRMEKRIKAILEHLRGGDVEDGGNSKNSKNGKNNEAKSLPGVVLLHARAPDANKLVSIAEIVKRRIREGHFADNEGATPTNNTKKPNKTSKKKKGKDVHAAAVAWYQYDRIYDVKTARKRVDVDAGPLDDDDDDDEEAEVFEPAMHRLEAALTDKASSTTKITTYMSIILSRTPIPELHRNADITVQCSTDPLEVEYEQFMAEA